MEKTLSLGAFEELSENEIMKTEGGFWQYVAAAGVVIVPCAIVCVVETFKTKQAEKRAKASCRAYVDTVNQNLDTYPMSAIETARHFCNEYGWEY